MNADSRASQTDGQFEELVARLADEFIDRLQRGEDVRIEEYESQYPTAASVIRRTFGALKEMRSVDLWEAATDGDPPPAFGDFRLVRVLGRGGMGVVYEAEQVSLSRRVALKVLPFAAMLDERSLQRFRNEVTAAAQLDHPNVVPVYGVGCDRGVYHYAMRLIDGRTLKDIVDQLRDLKDQQEELPPFISALSSDLSTADRAQEDSRPGASSTTIGSRKTREAFSFYQSIAELGATIAAALENAHERGVVHRDVKPSNILIDATGKPWITDFGLAHVETEQSLTVTGDLLGTARYMSPEQLMGKRIVLDHRTDLYSLGVTLYELLTLRVPFDAESRETLYQKILLDDPQKPRAINGSIDKDLETIVLKAIEKNPADRYQTAQDLADDLTRFCQQKPIRARKATWGIKARRWVQRNVGFVSGALSVLTVAFVAMAIAVTWLLAERNEKQLALNEAIKERNDKIGALQKADHERKRAAGNLEHALASVQGFLLEFSTARWARTPGAERQRQKFLRRAVDLLDKLVDENPQQVDLRQAFANALFQLGTLSSSLRSDEFADRCFARCIATRKALLKEHSAPEFELLVGIVRAYAGRGVACARVRPQMAELYYQEALTRCRKVMARYSRQRVSETLAEMLNGYGTILSNQQRTAEAIEAFSEALDFCGSSFRGTILHNLAKIRFGQQQDHEALDLVDRAISCPRQSRLWLTNHFILKARIHFRRRQHRRALAAATRSLELARRVAKLPQRSGFGLGTDTVGSLAISKRTHAHVIIELLLFRAQVLAKLDRWSDALNCITEARGVHLTLTGPSINGLDNDELQLRSTIETRLAESQSAVGQNVAAKATLGRAELLARRITKTLTGWTFAIDSGSRSTITTGPDDHLYVVGQFSGTSDFDPGVQRTSLRSNGGLDGYIAKYTRNRQLVWVRGIGGRRDEWAKSVAVDLSGNVYIAGDFESSSVNVGTTTLRRSRGKKNAFLVKLDKHGSLLWAVCFRQQKLTSLAVGPNNVVVAGAFEGTVDFDPGKAQVLKASAGKRDGYVACFDPTGKFRWVWVYGSKASEAYPRVDVDSSGYVFATGTFKSKVRVGKAQWLQSAGSHDSFLAKLTPQGKLTWVRHFSSSKSVWLTRCRVARDGSVYFSCVSAGTVRVNAAGPTMKWTRKRTRSILLRIDTDNTIQWARQYASTQNLLIRALSFDTARRIIIGGAFNGTFSLPERSSGRPLRSSAGFDSFLLGLDPASGDCQFADQLSGPSAELGNVAVDSENAVYLRGIFLEHIVSPTGRVTYTRTIEEGKGSFVARLNIFSPCIGIVPIDNHVTSEGGKRSRQGVVLSQAPRANVTLQIHSSDPSEGVVNVPQLTFTPQNWNRQQIITVTGVPDGLNDRDVQYFIVVDSASSADPVYARLKPTRVRMINQGHVEYHSRDAPQQLAIGDRGQPGKTSSKLFVPANLTIRDVNVRVNVDHPSIRDLEIALVAPDDTRIELFSMGNPHGGANLAATQFDQTAALTFKDAQPPFRGAFRPLGDLTRLNGKRARGTWRLEIQNRAAGRTMQLIAWSLEIAHSGTVAVADSYSGRLSTKLSVDAANGVLRNDSDGEAELLTASLVSRPSHAKIFSLGSDGSIQYVPVDDFIGVDSFTYKAFDGVNDSQPVKVRLTIK